MDKLSRYEEGQGMVEYGLIVALIAVVCIVGFRALGSATKDNAESVADEMSLGTPV